VRFACTVAGSGIFLEANKSLARRLGLGDLVRFPGFVPSADALLEQADIYVLPSLEEGSGAISLLEAMKKGVAIVTTLCDGIPEDFVPGETGLLVPPADPVAMADALEPLLSDPVLRARLAAAVRADYARRFSFEKMRTGIIEVLAPL
jgi:glycosyltransferase involved in cell wall biosynthesis